MNALRRTTTSVCLRATAAVPHRPPPAAARAMGTAKQGSSGRGWYKKYEKEGEEGFQKYNPPTPFDWSEAGVTSLVYLDVSVDGADPSRVEIELLDEILPITTTNFKVGGWVGGWVGGVDRDGWRGNVAPS